MKKRTNEQKKERMNEKKNERMKKRTNERNFEISDIIYAIFIFNP